MRTPSQSAGAPDSLFRSHPPTHTPLYPTLCIAPHHAHPCLSLFLSLHHMRTHTHTHLSLSSPADVEAACCCLPLLQMTLKLVWQSCTWWPNDSGWSGSAGNGVNRSRGITMTWRLLQGGRVPGLAGWPSEAAPLQRHSTEQIQVSRGHSERVLGSGWQEMRYAVRRVSPDEVRCQEGALSGCH